LIVEGIQKKENFNAMISEKLDSYNDTVSADEKITNDNFKEWSKAIDEIEIPENVFNVFDVIRKKYNCTMIMTKKKKIRFIFPIAAGEKLFVYCELPHF